MDRRRKCGRQSPTLFSSPPPPPALFSPLLLSYFSSSLTRSLESRHERASVSEQRDRFRRHDNRSPLAVMAAFQGRIFSARNYVFTFRSAPSAIIL